MADAAASKAAVRKGVRVRVPLRAPTATSGFVVVSLGVGLQRRSLSETSRRRPNPTFHTTGITTGAQRAERCTGAWRGTCQPGAVHRCRVGADCGRQRSIGGVTDRDRPLMTRILRSVAFVLALATAGLGAGAFAWSAGGTAAAWSGFTPLPPGWELCVLGGVGAPATAANVADLDEWQAAEGGSTNNTAAFNPYNTLRTTDSTGRGHPRHDHSGTASRRSPPGRPAVLATVATLFQPNMWVITAALRAGNVTPAAAFLAVVDQSSWCAPSPAGVPCYVNAMEITPGSLALDIPASSALDVYGNVNTDLQSYQQSIATVAADENVVRRPQSGTGGRRRPGGRRPRQARRRIPCPPGVCHQRVRQQRAVFGRPAREQRGHPAADRQHAAGLGRRRGAAVPRRRGQQPDRPQQRGRGRRQGAPSSTAATPPRLWPRPP